MDLHADAGAWQSVADAYCRFLLSSGKSPQTARTYKSNLALFWRWCGQNRFEAIGAGRTEVREYISLRRETLSSGRAHNDLAALRLFYAWRIEDRLRDDNPTEGLRVKRGKTLPTKPLSPEEIDRLLSACTRERDRLIVLVLAHTGVRISELADIRVEDVDWAAGLLVVRGKGSKERLLAPHSDVLGRLRAYLGMFPEPGPIWRSERAHAPLSGHQIRKILYEVATRAKLDGVHPHRFRASFATEFVGQYKDIQALQGLLGHESIETTAAYSQYTRQQRGLSAMRGFKMGAA